MKNLSVFILFIIASSLFYAGCEYDTPQQIYPRESAPDPIITSMVPESAENGVLEIKILGTNFSTDPNQNFVYFGTIEGHVINATENEVTVLRPVSIRGEHLIKLSVRESFSIAEFGPYSLEPGIMAISQPGEINSFAVDNDENVYYEYDEVVYKVSPSGEITEFGTFDARSSAMRVGPGGDLYIQRDDNRDIYKIPSSGGNAEKFLRVRRNVSYFDFDSKGNIYSGGEKYGICFTTPDNNSVETGLYQRTFYIKAVRIF